MNGARLALGLILLQVACGGGAATTPEGALQKLLDAATRGDPRAFREGFPSAETLAELFDCPSELDLGKRYDGISDEFVAWRDARPTIAGAIAASEDTNVGPGAHVGPCSARRAMHLVLAELKLSEGGTEKPYRMRFVEIDGRYHVLAF